MRDVFGERKGEPGQRQLVSRTEEERGREGETDRRISFQWPERRSRTGEEEKTRTVSWGGAGGAPKVDFDHIR